MENSTENVPRVMIFPVTMTCNSRCRSCGIWRLPDTDKGHSPQTLLERVVTDPFLRKYVQSVNISGGEPLSHPRLADFLAQVTLDYASLREVNINTDGHLIDRLDELARVLLPLCRERDATFRVYISLDGMGQAHDRHRRHPGAFELADRALRHLAELRCEWPETLRLTASFTVTDWNTDQMLPVFEYVKAVGARVDYNLAARPEVFIGGGGLQKDYQVLEEQAAIVRYAIREVTAEPEHLNFTKDFYATMLETLESGRRQRGCFFPKKGFVLMPDGKIYVCGTYRDFYFGTLHEDDFETLWRGRRRSSCLSEQIPGKCETCFSNSYEDWDLAAGAVV